MLTTLPQSCAVVMKSGNIKFLETSGPLQASNGTALPLPLICIFMYALAQKAPLTGPQNQHFNYITRPTALNKTYLTYTHF